MRTEQIGITLYVFVDGNERITDVVPINCDRATTTKVVIKKDNCVGTPTLILEASQAMQPCIGYKTNTGMSYGRFGINGHSLYDIVIDGVIVDCVPNSKNVGFSLGTYGKEEVPRVQCINGGILRAPEMNGKRIMIDNICSYSGSTKLTGTADYYILENGGQPEKFCSQEWHELKAAIVKERYDLHSSITYRVGIRYLRILKELLDLGCIIQKEDMHLFEGQYNDTYAMVLRTAKILCMHSSTVTSQELLFEITKANHIREMFYDTWIEDNVCTDVCLAMLYFLTYDSPNKALLWEQAYESIPTYYYQFERGRTHKEHVVAFIKEHLPEWDKALSQLANVKKGMKAKMRKFENMTASDVEGLLDRLAE